MASSDLGRLICWIAGWFVLSCYGLPSISTAQAETTNDSLRDQNRAASASNPVAQDPAADTKRPEQVPPETPQRIDKKRRAELMKFVRQNHPELAPLINSLKSERPAQYQAALRSLDRDVSSLNALKAKLPEPRYQQAVDNWKLRSRIQLLTAQLSITDTPAKRKKLRRLIVRQIDNRIEQLSAELERLNQVVERIDGNVTDLKSNRAAEIQRQMDTVVRTAERIRLLRQLELNRAKGSSDKSRPRNAPAQSKTAIDKDQDDK